MSKKTERYSLHHKLPSSKEGNSSEYNLQMIKDTTHRAIHTLFSNDIFPDQLKKLIGINYSALKQEVIAELFEIIEKRGEDAHERYRDEVFNNKKH